MRPRFYKLNGHEPVALTDPDAMLRWAESQGEETKRVAFTDLGFCTVSTVFLGLDHNHLGVGPPILFETMVFANPVKGEIFPEELDGMMRRYVTWDEAAAGHDEMVAEVRQGFWKRRANGK